LRWWTIRWCGPLEAVALALVAPRPSYRGAGVLTARGPSQPPSTIRDPREPPPATEATPSLLLVLTLLDEDPSGEVTVMVRPLPVQWASLRVLWA
jgi:hypothetical protein